MIAEALMIPSNMTLFLPVGKFTLLKVTTELMTLSGKLTASV